MKNPFFYLVSKFWKYSGKLKLKIILIYVLFVISMIFAELEPIIIGMLVNTLQEGGDNVIQNSIFWLLMFPATQILFWIFHGSARLIERDLGFHTFKNYNLNIFKRLTNLPYKWHKDNHTGSTMSRIKTSSNAIGSFSEESFMFIQTFTTITISGAAILFFTPLIGSLAIALGVLTTLVIIKFDKILAKLLDKINERKHQVYSTIYDYISNIKTVINLNLEKLAEKEINKKFLNYYPIWKKNSLLNELKWFSVNMLLIVLALSVYFSYIWNSFQTTGTIMIGSFIILQQYTYRFKEVFFSIAWQYEKLVWYKTDIETADPIFKAKINEQITSSEKIKPWNKIEIKNLYFKYQDEKKKKHNLQNININLEKGKKIGFVGESGSGKSTLIHILKGLDKPQKVKFTIDNEKNDFSSLYNLTTLIPQEPEIFENTIEYNITIGHPKNKQKIQSTLKEAAFDKVVKRLPKGLKTNIKEKGVNLSGGEKQRLALARGIYSINENDIILLDEPTSSVDAHNEASIYENIFKNYSDKCIISSLHRLHLLEKFDHIYVFENGKIVSEGTFNQLKKQSPQFKKMWDKYIKSEKKTTSKT